MVRVEEYDKRVVRLTLNSIGVDNLILALVENGFCVRKVNTGVECNGDYYSDVLFWGGPFMVEDSDGRKD